MHDAFRAPRLLRALNVAAVGFLMAACAGVALSVVFGPNNHLTPPDGVGLSPPLASAFTTLAAGLVWARGFRTRIAGLPVGWLTCVPLAALNAGMALGLILLTERSG